MSYVYVDILLKLGIMTTVFNFPDILSLRDFQTNCFKFQESFKIKNLAHRLYILYFHQYYIRFRYDCRLNLHWAYFKKDICNLNLKNYFKIIFNKTVFFKDIKTFLLPIKKNLQKNIEISFI